MFGHSRGGIAEDRVGARHSVGKGAIVVKTIGSVAYLHGAAEIALLGFIGTEGPGRRTTNGDVRRVNRAAL